MKLLLLLGACALALAAQSNPGYWITPTTYDGAIPTEKAVLGHEPGERISSPAEILTYMKALAAAAPARIKIVEYARSWEGRPLVYAVIGSAANIARLTEIQQSMLLLADPRKTSPADASALMAKLPALVWLAYGVHGNEISSPDAALLTAYHLLAARGDALVDEILAQDLVLIDPLENPDGRNRFVQSFEVAEGLRPDPNQIAAEHNEPWPGGRTNHYYFDMNRDWFAMTQPETRGRIAAVRQWMPLVFVDLHEMGSDSSYYFAPEANPYNPFITDQQKGSLEWFGKNNARYFDQLGLNYFSKEGYDEFYPGYGASWPLYYGGIGMTYEQGSTRGLIVKKSDGTTVTYGDTVRRHFITSISTLQVAAQNSGALKKNFYAYRQAAIAEGQRSPVRAYIIQREGNVSEADKLAANLTDQGVEIERATAPFDSEGKTYPAGSYVIPFAQPSYRLLRALLDPQISMDPQFLTAEEQRRTSRQPSEMYDVTAWSLPLQYGLKLVAAKAGPQGSFVPVPEHFVLPGTVTGGPAQLAYLVPWGTGAAGHFLGAALREHVRVASSDRPFALGGRRYPAGTLIVKVKENGADIGPHVSALAKATGAQVFTTDSGWMDEGPNFGSNHTATFPSDLRIAMAWDRPVLASAAGAVRFILERQFGFPVTIVRSAQLAGADLSQFQVILLPDSADGYGSVFGPNGERRLQAWVQNGGTLVALGAGAAAYLASPPLNLLALRQEYAADDHSTDEKRATPAARNASRAPGNESTEPPEGATGRVAGKDLTSEKEMLADTVARTDLPDALHGVLLRAKVDGNSWLTAGVPGEVAAMVTGRTIFSPIKADRGVNAVYFEGPEKILASGFMWEPNRKQLAYKPFAVTQREGRGNVVAFTADPAFRGYMDGLNVLLLNAVFRGPLHLGPMSAQGEE